MYTHIYIYIYRERERYIHDYISLYICMIGLVVLVTCAIIDVFVLASSCVEASRTL